MIKTKELTSQELCEKQLEMMDKFHEFCIHNNLTYYLAFGTLLGAVRHKGFIPWDDDIDICMIREDYNKLITISQKWDLPFDFVCYEDNSDYVNYFGKLSDRGTILDYTYMDDSLKTGVFIDIFPVDKVFLDSREKKHFEKQMKYSIKMLRLSNQKKPWPSDSIIKSIMKDFLYVCSKLFGNKFWMKRINALTKIKYNDTKKVASYVHGDSVFTEDYFKSGTLLKFESRYYNCPSEYDKYLRHVFGDYMKMPPIEEQKSVHDFKVYWKA